MEKQNKKSNRSEHNKVENILGIIKKKNKQRDVDL